jgi:hypothetical protein
MRYCKVKSTGQVIETQSGVGDLEMFYVNNSGQYSRDELEVGIADDDVVEGWWQSQYEASRTYSDHRATAYASLPDQADMQYWDSVNGTTVWQDHIARVKAKYPKGAN